MFKKSLIAAAALSLVAGASQAQLLNGGFQGSEPNGEFSQYLPGSVPGPGGNWTVVGTNGVRFIKDNEATAIGSGPGEDPTLVYYRDSEISTADDSGVWVDLTGMQQGTAALGSGVSQTFNLISGQSYSLTFDVGVLPAFNHPASVMVTGTSFGSQLFTNENVSGGLLGEQNWQGFTLNFVATSTINTIQFVGALNPNALQPQYLSIGLDNIQITQVSEVPEPSAYAMMIAGLGVLGFAARRKRKSA